MEIPPVDGPAPNPCFRLIASRFPPIGAFDEVASASDLEAVMELEGWTNDRLVAERVRRLERDQWVYGIPNASIAMAAFLHAAPDGSRFNGPMLGAWYAAAAEKTAIAEIAHHLRQEARARGLAEQRRIFRCYRARLDGTGYRDLRGMAASVPDLYDPFSYARSQEYGEAARAAGRDGIVYDSVRHAGGTCVVAYRPRLVGDITQTVYYDVIAPVRGRIVARQLAAAP